MRDEDVPKVICRDIKLNNIEMTVYFWFYAPYDTTRDEPGFDGEIEIESIWIDDYEVSCLFGTKSIEDVEKELWKLYYEGGDV
jgi:hypothetical protein